MISLPIINAFISAGAFKTRSVLCRIIKDELLEVYVWSNADKCFIPRPPGPTLQDTLGFRSSSDSASDSDSIGHRKGFHTPSKGGKGMWEPSFTAGDRGRRRNFMQWTKMIASPRINQNKPVLTAGISIWSNPQSHLCPNIRVYFDVSNSS